MISSKRVFLLLAVTAFFLLIAFSMSTIGAELVGQSAATQAFAESSSSEETEQPELSDETKRLVILYQHNPTQKNYLNLRAKVIEDYDAVVARKEAKLEELREETAGKPGGEEKVAEMEEIVQEMYKTYWNRINSTMLRFSDSRLLSWDISSANEHDYIPVMGAGASVYIGRTEVTCAQYALFVAATGHDAPANWVAGTYAKGEGDFPVTDVSEDDALDYCAWLTAQDGTNTYRLPSESEWELAAGHMPKDAEFNCGVANGVTSVEAYAVVTRGAHGAVDFWGNVWEWTSTFRTDGNLGVKGGAWNSARTDCRTEYRRAGRDGGKGYEDVGFRVIQVQGGNEPEQKVELATLASPVITCAESVSAGCVFLQWQAVEGATEYQLFSYDDQTGLVEMLGTTTGTNVTFESLTPGSVQRYIVQPISLLEVADNVYGENSVCVTVSGTAKVTRLAGDNAMGTMTKIVQSGWADGSCETVVLATFDGYWDALSASPLAGLYHCPVLLTWSNSLASEALEQIERLGTKKVIVAGGPAAVSEDVVIALHLKGLQVERVAGSNAASTAVAAYRAGAGSWGTTCIVATSNGYYDALSASPYGYAQAAPVFLTEWDGSLSADTVAAIREGGFTRVIVAGGTACVTNAEASALGAATGAEIKRCAGANCFGTSVALAELCLADGMTMGNVGYATGLGGYWDALSGGALCGKCASPLLLVDDGYEDAISFAKEHGSQGVATIFGGTAAVSLDVQSRIG